MRQLRYHYPAAQYEDRRRLALDCGEYGQVRALRIAQGMKPDPKKSLDNWIARGHIKQLERGRYVK